MIAKRRDWPRIRAVVGEGSSCAHEPGYIQNAKDSRDFSDYFMFPELFVKLRT